MDDVLVLDIGSSYTKVGPATKEAPTIIFHTIVGEPKLSKRMGEKKAKDLFIGNEVLDHFGVVKSKFPVKKGVVRDWGSYEALLKYALNRTDLNFKEVPLLYSFPPFFQERMIDRIAKLLFDRIGVPSLVACSHPYLIKQVSSKENALIVESGGGRTSITPVFNDRVSLSLSSSFPIAGRDITERLAKLLEARGYNFATPAEKENIRQMKEKLCYFASDFSKERKKNTKEIQKTYRLPDGREITVSEERFESPEIMYRPREIGRREPPLHEKIYDVIRSCEITIKPKLVRNIILSGGNTLIPGFKERLQKELEEALPSKMREKLSISEIPDPNIAVWRGGAITASSKIFDKLKTTKLEWRKKKTLF